MAYTKIIKTVVDKIKNLAESRGETILVMETFPESQDSERSCIVQLENTDRFGVIGTDIEGYDAGICFFRFNGKLYNYCKAEGFTRAQMTEDESFEGKVLVKSTEDEFIQFILGG